MLSSISIIHGHNTINAGSINSKQKSKNCSLVFPVQSSTLIANISKPRNRRYLPESKQNIVVPGERGIEMSQRVGFWTPEISDYAMLFQLRSNISWQFQLQKL
jgi:hypothetical protein